MVLMTSSLKNSQHLDAKDRAGALATWPKHLRTPAELVEALKSKTRLGITRSPLGSKLVLQFIGSLSYLLAHFLNKTQVYNGNVLERELRRLEKQNQSHTILLPKQPITCNNHNNPKSVPLLTLSNHISCIDDPVLWAILLPFGYYYTNTETVRWSAAATDICFSKPWHSAFFSLGKTFPIMRGVGLDQPAMDFAMALLKHGQWLHLFPEGRVMRNDQQEVISNQERGYIFKWGVSKLILDYFATTKNEDMSPTKQISEIRILPFYHLGMDKVLPIGWPYLPRFNKKITVYMRPSAIKIDSRGLGEILATRVLPLGVSKSKTNDEIARIKLTNYLEDLVFELIDPASRLHESRP